MEHHIYLHSGTAVNQASFSNELMEVARIDHSPGTWHIALLEINFHNYFLNRHLPSRPDFPSIMLIPQSTTVDDFKDIPDQQKVLLPQQFMSQFHLTSFLDKHSIQIWFEYRPALDRLKMWIKKSLALRSYLWMHVNFFKYLFSDLPEGAVMTEIHQESYVVMDPIQWPTLSPLSSYVYLESTKTMNDFLKTYYQPLYHIHCREVEPQVTSRGLQPIIGSVSIPVQRAIDSKTNYYHWEIKHPVFTKLTCKSLKRLSVDIKDVQGQPILLAPGAPTVVHLVLKKIVSMDTYMIRVTATHKNKAQFSVNLPKPIPWKWAEVALVSAALPLTLKNQLTVDERTVKIMFKSQESEQVMSFTIVLPEASRSADDLVYAIDHQTNLGVRSHIDAGKQSLVITVPENMDMVMQLHRKLHTFLGGDRQEEAMVTIQTALPYVYPRGPRYESLLPTNLYIYSNLVKPSPIGTSVKPILRTLPITHQKQGHYAMFEITHMHYLPCILNSPRQFDVEIQADNGKQVPFADDESEAVELLLSFRYVE